MKGTLNHEATDNPSHYLQASIGLGGNTLARVDYNYNP